MPLHVYEHYTTPCLYERAPAARGQGVVAFFDRLTDLKTENNGGFRADPLAKYHRFLFFEILFKDFSKFCTPKYALYPVVQALSHSQLSLYKPTLSFNFFSLLSIIFQISFPINHVIPKHVFRHKI